MLIIVSFLNKKIYCINVNIYSTCSKDENRFKYALHL